MLIPVPALAKTETGESVILAESDRRDYPGLWLKKRSSKSLSAVFPRVVKSGENPSEEKKIKRETYIAETDMNRAFPWRIFSVHQNDKAILDDQTVEILSPENGNEDNSWIKPGKAAWDWWNPHNITGVGFKTGFNTETYKYYIDFASRFKIQYIIMDEGWSEKNNIDRPVKSIDIKELVEYARGKGVGIFLWSRWQDINRNPENMMRIFRSWGIKGVKIDFLDRDDQGMTRFCWRVAEAAYRNHILVDFHGSAYPAGIARSFPNVLTSEGVKGLEHNKLSDQCTPDNDVYIPFLRMFAGPVDYTPGSMRNSGKEDFRIVFNDPSSIGTRVHQMAMYTVLESPFSMMADSPSRYMKDETCTLFIAGVPVTWDESVVLDAKMGEYVCIARKKGDVWYIGAITNGKRADIDVDLSFLERAGAYHAEIFSDGVNASRNAEDYLHERTLVDRKSRIKIRCAPGGGWTCRISK
jgi:alpha-glucosidase